MWHQLKIRRPVSPAPLRRIGAALLLPPFLWLAGCSEPGNAAATPGTGGDAQRGRMEIAAVGCGSCHVIPGIATAKGLVGPPLDHIARRIFLAGMVRNTPDNMTRWIEDPQKIVPGNAMPDMGLTPAQARDITAYLYTIR
jgi:cytochrome c2